MEYLSPPLLQGIREIRWQMACGRSVRDSVRLHLSNHCNDFTEELREWAINEDLKSTVQKKTSSHRQIFLDLLRRGFNGEPILTPLIELEKSVEELVDDELEKHLADLPIKILLPLLLFQFPAFLILLLGPLFKELSQQLGGS